MMKAKHTTETARASQIQTESEILKSIKADIVAKDSYRINKIPAPLFGDGFSDEMRKITTLTKYLELDTWSPIQAAMLVSGLQPPQDCYTFPDGAMSLENAFLMPNTDRFHQAKRVLELWNSQEDPPAKVKPQNFVAWCNSKNIDTGWLTNSGELVLEAQAGTLIKLEAAASSLAYDLWHDESGEELALRSLQAMGMNAGCFTPIYAMRSLAELRFQRIIDELISANKIKFIDPVTLTPTREILHAWVNKDELKKLIDSGEVFQSEKAQATPPVSTPEVPQQPVTKKLTARDKARATISAFIEVITPLAVARHVDFDPMNAPNKTAFFNAMKSWTQKNTAYSKVRSIGVFDEHRKNPYLIKFARGLQDDRNSTYYSMLLAVMEK